MQVSDSESVSKVLKIAVHLEGFLGNENLDRCYQGYLGLSILCNILKDISLGYPISTRITVWYLLKVLGHGRVRDAGAGHLKRPMQTLPDDNRKILKDATAAFPVTFHLLLGGWMDHMIGVLTSQTVSANFVSSQSAVLL